METGPNDIAQAVSATLISMCQWVRSYIAWSEWVDCIMCCIYLNEEWAQ